MFFIYWFVAISRILFPISKAIDIYLGCKLLYTSSDSDSEQSSENTILHTHKDLAVSLFNFILSDLYEDSSIAGARFFRITSVSARTSTIACDGYYPLWFPNRSRDMCSDFPHPPIRRTHLFTTNHKQYIRLISAWQYHSNLIYSI